MSIGVENFFAALPDRPVPLSQSGLNCHRPGLDLATGERTRRGGRDRSAAAVSVFAGLRNVWLGWPVHPTPRDLRRLSHSATSIYPNSRFRPIGGGIVGLVSVAESSLRVSP